MFCTKCGKKIDYDASVCNECLQAEGGFFNNTAQQETPVEEIPIQVNEPKAVNASEPQSSRKKGFVPALISTILGFIGYMVAAFATGMSSAGVEPGLIRDEEVAIVIAVMVAACILVAFVLSIISIILGIKSIFTFKKATPKPIATLILGIIGAVLSVAGLLFNCAALLFMIAMFIAL